MQRGGGGGGGGLRRKGRRFRELENGQMFQLEGQKKNTRKMKKKLQWEREQVQCTRRRGDEMDQKRDWTT